MGGPLRWRWLLALALLTALAVACNSSPAAASPSINASVLVEASGSDAQWFRDLSVPAGTDGYELLETAVDGDLEAQWFPEYRSHFVNTILGKAPQGQQFWAVFLWNDSTNAWEPLPFGADLLSVKDGLVVGWALVEYDPDSPQLPTSVP